MLTRLRLFLACLVMVALPLQGLAAATMAFCESGGAHEAQVQATVAHDHAVHGNAAHQHGDADHDMQADAHAAYDHAGKSGSLPDAGHKCGVCAACCHGAVIAGFTATPVQPALPQADMAEPFVLIHARASSVPDKPPRLTRV
jgi:hypothetical protein